MHDLVAFIVMMVFMPPVLVGLVWLVHETAESGEWPSMLFCLLLLVGLGAGFVDQIVQRL